MENWDQIYDRAYAKEYDAFCKSPDWVEVAQEAKESDVAALLKCINDIKCEPAINLLNQIIRSVADGHADMLAISEADNFCGVTWV